MGIKKVGLALGSGDARGLAHIGVLEVLEKEGIPIDIIAGTSAGSIAGALYAQGKNVNQIKKLVLDMGWKKLGPLIDLSLPVNGFIKGKKIRALLVSFIGSDIKFSELKIPFACVATDIETGEEVVLNQGSVSEAVRASISIPAIFTVAKRGNRYLVDGALVNPVPVNIVKQMGADFIIAVNVIPDVADRVQQISKELVPKPKEPNMIHVMIQSMHIGTYSLVRSSLEKADIVIEPHLVHIGAGEFHRARECIQEGKLAAQEAIPEIKRRLEALNLQLPIHSF
ncbi:patatin-like phospholipase family protein [Chloroflexota bacterium]